MTITIWHNPACGTSRNTLAMIRASGIEPNVVEYLKAPPSRATLERLARGVGGARPLLREKGTPFGDLGLGDLALADSALLDALEAHPILLNRPVVESRRGVAVCRPSERVLDLLDTPLASDFVNEDGARIPAARA